MDSDDIEVRLFRSIPASARIVKRFEAYVLMRTLSRSIQEKILEKEQVCTSLLDSDHDPLLVGEIGMLLAAFRDAGTGNGLL